MESRRSRVDKTYTYDTNENQTKGKGNIINIKLYKLPKNLK